MSSRLRSHKLHFFQQQPWASVNLFQRPSLHRRCIGVEHVPAGSVGGQAAGRAGSPLQVRRVQATVQQPQRAPDRTPVHYESHRLEQMTLHRLVRQHAATFFKQAEDAAGAD